MEEMSSIAARNSQTIQKNDAMFAEFSRLIGHAVDEVEKTIGMVEKIQVSSKETADMIRNFDDIAFQTKILALNAAVEAERAGDSGKGFGIVAEQLKGIAMKSMDASKRASALTEAAGTEFNDAAASAKETALSLKSIRTYEADTSMMISQILDTMRAQTDELARIRGALARIDMTALQNSESAGRADQEMAEMAEEAKKMNSNLWNLKKVVWGHPALPSSSQKSSKVSIQTEIVSTQKAKLSPNVNEYNKQKSAPRTGGVVFSGKSDEE